MPIDPNIPLQAGRGVPSFGPDMQAIADAQRTAIAIANQQRVEQAQNALKALYSNTDNFDPKTLQPTPQAMNALMRISPAAGMDLTNNLAAIQEKQTRQQFTQGQVGQQYQDQAQKMRVGALSLYDQYLKTMPPDQAMKRVQEEYWTPQAAELRRNVPPELAQGIPLNFDPVRVRPNAAAYTTAQNAAKDAEQQRKLDQEFEVRTDPGTGTEYRLYKSGRTTSLQGDPYTPTGTATPQKPPEMFEGTVGGKTQRLIAAPGGKGWETVDGKPVDDADVSNLRKVGSTDADMGKWQILTDPTTNKQYRYNMQTKEATDLQGAPYTPGGAARMGPAQGKNDFTDSDVQYWANVLKNGGHFPPGLSRTAAGSQLVQEVMKNISQTSKNPNELIANAATVKADSASLSSLQKMTDAATSFEKTAAKNFDLALSLSKGAVPTNWGPLVNRWIESGETQFGDEDVPPYVTAMLTGANEYAKIMSGSTGAQGSTVDSRREAAELFSPYLNKNQIDRVVAVAKADMHNRMESLNGQIDDIKSRISGAGSGGSPEKQSASSQPAGQAAPTAAPPPPLPPPDANGEYHITDPSQLKLLPSGTKTFRAPDGKQYLVPAGQ